MDDKQLAKELGILLETWGVDEYGFADLEQVKEGLDFEYGKVWRDYTRAVSFAVYFPWAVSRGAPDCSYSYLSGSIRYT